MTSDSEAAGQRKQSTSNSEAVGQRKQPTKRRALALGLLTVLICAWVAYWYAYGRERDLLDRSKDDAFWQTLFFGLNGKLSLKPSGRGSTVSGVQ
jgi:hypothetical protein